MSEILLLTHLWNGFPNLEVFKAQSESLHERFQHSQFRSLRSQLFCEQVSFNLATFGRSEGTFRKKNYFSEHCILVLLTEVCIYWLRLTFQITPCEVYSLKRPSVSKVYHSKLTLEEISKAPWPASRLCILEKTDKGLGHFWRDLIRSLLNELQLLFLTLDLDQHYQTSLRR